MILCGLMPVNRDLDKPDIGSVKQMGLLSDVAIILDDKSRVPFSNNHGEIESANDRIEVLRSDHCLDHWNDYANRLTLLARSCAYDAEWVLWMDDDDLVEEGVTKAFLKQQIQQAESEGFQAISYRCREMWNEPGQYRCDGLYKEKRKLVLQKNPFFSQSVKWMYGPKRRLHCWPLADAPIKYVETQLMHFGMLTAAQRQKRYSRYLALDPDNTFHKQGYGHILNETGIEYGFIKSTLE